MSVRKKVIQKKPEKVKKIKPITAVNINCIVTGKKQYVFGVTLKKRIQHFGSLDELTKHFICRKAKKLLKEGLTVDEVRAKLKVKKELSTVSQESLNLNKIKAKKIKPAEVVKQNVDYINSNDFKKKKIRENNTLNTWGSFKLFVEEMTGGPNGCQISKGGTCQNPHIWFDNEEFCDGCTWFQFCLVSRKRLLKRRASS